MPRICPEGADVCDETLLGGGAASSCCLLPEVTDAARSETMRWLSVYAHEGTWWVTHCPQGLFRSHRTLRRRHSMQEWAGRRRFRTVRAESCIVDTQRIMRMKLTIQSTVQRMLRCSGSGSGITQWSRRYPRRYVFELIGAAVKYNL